MAKTAITVITEHGKASFGVVVGAGINIHEDFEAQVFCEFHCERIYLWQPTINLWEDYVWFLSELIADPQKAKKPWKTFAACLKIAQSYTSLFEAASIQGYWWVPNFQFKKELKPPDYIL